MKDDVRTDLSHDRLSALVDGELEGSDEARLLDAIRRDPALERKMGELHLIKALLRHAYRDEFPGDRKRQRRPRGRRWLAVAAVVLLAVGIGAGWTGRGWQDGDGDTDLSRLAFRMGTVTQMGATDKIVLHVSSSAPERVSSMFDEVEGMLRAARVSDRSITIEILANSTGLDVLRTDVTGPSGRLASLRAANPNLTLVACGQTIERLRERGVVVHLLPRTTIAPSALDEVVKRHHEGWTYVRT